jgi:uncharacterized protein (TIGR03663 family)
MDRWRFVILLILLVAVGALVFRLPRLRMRPMHADEANQAHKTGVLYETGRYEYDPVEHHGPTLYYLTLPVFWLSGTDSFAESTEVTYRILPVIFGAALVALLCLVTDGLGRAEAVWAAVLTAVSPSMVYYSRYYIQEMLLVFFTFLAIAAGWRYKRTRHVGWVIVAGLALGLMHATKETAVIAWVALFIALMAKLAWRAWRNRAMAKLLAEKGVLPPEDEELAPDDEMPDAVPARRYPVWHFLVALVAGIAVSALFFSSFGSHADGVRDSLATYGAYLTRSGENASHGGPWHFYLSMLLYAGGSKSPWWVGLAFALVAVLVVALVVAILKRRGASIVHGHMALRIFAVLVVGLASAYAIIPAVQYYREALGGGRRGGPWWSEGFVVALAVAGIAAAKMRCGVTRTHAPFVRFLAVYTVVNLALYSAIPYKTPWCVLGFLHGGILLAGVGAVASVRLLPGRALKAAAWLILVAAAFQYGWESYRASYVLPTYRTNPYAYVHTSTDMLRLAERVEDLADVHPEGREMLIKVIADDPWPLPWYLRRFPKVGYWQQVPRNPSAPVVIAAEDTVSWLNDHLGPSHNREFYGIRRGVHLVVYIQNALWEAYLSRVAARAEPPVD